MCSDLSGESGRGLSAGSSRMRSSRSVRLQLEGSRSMSAPFEERSGVVPCGTPWGQWYQTLEEVFIEVQVPPGTRAQDIQCGLQSRHVALAVGGREILKGKLFDSTIADEGTWTLEDRKMVRIVLTKTKRDAANCWTSLLESEYAADPWVQDQMQRKLTLERFQKETTGGQTFLSMHLCNEIRRVAIPGQEPWNSEPPLSLSVAWSQQRQTRGGGGRPGLPGWE
uniref:NudC domain-containing protein 2 n=1 Tax=Canis lupus familiaris TaxID=9615 RepID=A0A8C0NSF8_CANLF